jgi:hypothetical protein
MSGILIDATYGGWVSGTTPAPTVTSLSAASGPWRVSANGCTGANFVTGATVKINGVSCSSVVFVSSTSLTFFIPGFSANGGPYNVVVTNPDTQTGTLAASYTVLWDPIDSLLLDSAGKRLWLDANVGVTTASSHVSAWADQSGDGNNASAGTGWTVATSWANGKSAILTDNATQMTIANSIITAPGDVVTCLSVVDAPSFAGGSADHNTLICFGGYPGPSIHLNAGDFFGGGTQWVYGDIQTGNITGTLTRAPLANPVHIEWLMKGYPNAMVHYIAAAAVTTSGTQLNAGALTSNTTLIGGRAGHYWNGHIAEIVVLRHTPNANELAGWTAYAKTKYGLAA